MPCPRTIRSTSPDVAPSATRTPNSRVLRLTEYAITPNTPAAANKSAVIPKNPTRITLNFREPSDAEYTC